MSLLFSDSLLGIIDEEALESGTDTVGTITIGDKQREIDAFIFDKRSIRVHVIANLEDALSSLDQISSIDAKITIGESFSLIGKIHQVGWEQVTNGGRLVIGVILRDK